MQINFEFTIGEKVCISDSGIIGKIDSMYVDSYCRIGYWVKYCDKNGAVFTNCFQAEEIKSI